MATLSEQLAEAKAAYHELMTGRMVRVAVDSNGERIEYTSANSAKLEAYIAKLESALANRNKNRGPAGVIF